MCVCAPNSYKIISYARYQEYSAYSCCLIIVGESDRRSILGSMIIQCVCVCVY